MNRDDEVRRLLSSTSFPAAEVEAETGPSPVAPPSSPRPVSNAAGLLETAIVLSNLDANAKVALIQLLGTLPDPTYNSIAQQCGFKPRNISNRPKGGKK